MEYQFTRERFIETINALEAQHEHDVRCADLLGKVYPDAMLCLYDNSLLTSQLLGMLKSAFQDTDDWVGHFMYELDFGKTYQPGDVTEADGTHIDLSDAGKLWDFLMSNMKPI